MNGNGILVKPPGPAYIERPSDTNRNRVLDHMDFALRFEEDLESPMDLALAAPHSFAVYRIAQLGPGLAGIMKEVHLDGKRADAEIRAPAVVFRGN